MNEIDYENVSVSEPMIEEKAKNLLDKEGIDLMNEKLQEIALSGVTRIGIPFLAEDEILPEEKDID